ncbi:chitinase [Polychytrium aggregatum]|uniref:chitinase n=1 Tax=Polychytrium aggregatum TaxID=110093 RepID=UPI0022FE2B68|nr:chitinase [Polychytrium aggregatum]KAI9209562.1 chitinase [Polychytrium aggregatum]
MFNQPTTTTTTTTTPAKTTTTSSSAVRTTTTKKSSTTTSPARTTTTTPAKTTTTTTTTTTTVATSTPTIQPGHWPAKLFAPYVDLGVWPPFDIVTEQKNTGVNYYTFAFVTSSGGAPSVAGYPLSQNWFVSTLQQIRANGGDAIISFGGAAGTELGDAITDATSLQAAYQSVINAYNATYIDFDIEGAAVSHTANIDRRNSVLAALQKANPGLKISYTLPVLPSGLVSTGVYIIQSAAKAGVVLDSINIMTMDYGSSAAPNGATGMGGYAISAAQNTYSQAISAGYPSPYITLCPMIGINDSTDEIFTLDNANQITTFVKTTSWANGIRMWSANRDQNSGSSTDTSSGVTQNPFDFAKTFNTIEA